MKTQLPNDNYQLTIHNCPGTLDKGIATYRPGCLRNLFNGKKVNHVLPYEQPPQSDKVAALFMENRKHLSISGVQEKLSLLLAKNVLRLIKKENRAYTYSSQYRRT